MIDPAAILKTCDPRIEPQGSDEVALSDVLYTVAARKGSAVHFETLDRGRRRDGRYMPLEAWRERMAKAIVAKVAGAGIDG